ncbi:MAG: DUF4878 domain-containing protein [Mycobacterium sp.]
MSNPSGDGNGDADRPAEAAGLPRADGDPVTEVIRIPADAGIAAAALDERRYTAPGFDAGSTQIIDRVPDAETEFIATSSSSFAAAAGTAPQAVPPRRRRWLIPILLVAAALAAAAILGVVLLKRAQAARASQEAVRSTIETFDAAVRKGDLATLRSVTCGQTREGYVNYDDNAWADAYARIAAAKQYPVVASIDEVVVNGEHAEANVTSYMAFDPATTSTRSFDLQLRDDQWKICQSS